MIHAINELTHLVKDNYTYDCETYELIRRLMEISNDVRLPYLHLFKMSINEEVNYSSEFQWLFFLFYLDVWYLCKTKNTYIKKTFRSILFFFLRFHLKKTTYYNNCFFQQKISTNLALFSNGVFRCSKIWLFSNLLSFFLFCLQSELILDWNFVSQFKYTYNW